MSIFSTIQSWFSPAKTEANSGYNAGSNGRRAAGWNASRLGPNTLLVQSLDQIRARSRDAVRNSAIARSACDHFESNVIGNGIVPHFLHPDPEVRLTIQKAWDSWAKKPDYDGQLSFAGVQALVAREMWDGGEAFVRFHVDNKRGLLVQTIEGEQVPIFQNFQLSKNQQAKAGIVFDSNGKRLGYQIYKNHPYDFITGSFSSTTEFIFVSVEDMLQIFKPLRAGQLRGEPFMTPVLTLLKDLEDFADAERARKKIGAMWAAFIQKPSVDDAPMFPAPMYDANLSANDDSSGVMSLAEMSPGTCQVLFPGETITFPQIPESGNFAEFMKVEMHKFAAGVGLTYEMVSGDLEKVNYSSIRCGMLEFRRSIEMLQRNVIVTQLCEPVLERWMTEAVLSGDLELPDDYYTDPTPYLNVAWCAPGFAWIDPAKEMTAYQLAVRSGFTSRTMVLRELGLDPEMIDAQQAEERKRAKDLGLAYDSDPNQILIKSASVPLVPEEITPDKDTHEIADETAQEDD